MAVIPVTLLEVHLSAPHPIDFGANPGSSIRGALYEALRAMYDTGVAVTTRRAVDLNPVAWLLRLEDEETSGGKDVPRPLAIRPPLGAASRQMSFGISVYGRGRDYASLLLSGIHAMQHIGLGRGRGHFTVDRVDVIDPLTWRAAPLLDGSGQRIGLLPEPPGTEAYTHLAKALHPETLCIEFLTPTRIVAGGKLCHKPAFRQWFQRLLERTRLLAELYTEAPIWVAFRELLAKADSITMIRDETHWVEAWSGSRRDGLMRPTSGFAGKVSYQGELGDLLPWLILGQALQVGKNTVKGCGWYRIDYQWH